MRAAFTPTFEESEERRARRRTAMTPRLTVSWRGVLTCCSLDRAAELGTQGVEHRCAGRPRYYRSLWLGMQHSSCGSSQGLTGPGVSQSSKVDDPCLAALW